MNKKYTSSLLYKLTICFSSSRLHRFCLLNVKSLHPKRYICLSEDKAMLIPPVGLEKWNWKDALGGSALLV